MPSTPGGPRLLTAAAVAVGLGTSLASPASATAQPTTPSFDCPGGPFPGPLPSPTLTAAKIKDGFNFLEGPTWDAATQTLLLTNMHDGTGPQNVQPSDILRYTPGDGTFATFLSGSGSNGLALDPQGNLVVAEFSTRQVTRRAARDR